MSKKTRIKVHVPSHRPMVEVQREYQALCMRAGDLQHRIIQNPVELDKVNARLLELNKEADQVAAFEAANAPKEEKPQPTK